MSGLLVPTAAPGYCNLCSKAEVPNPRAAHQYRPWPVGTGRPAGGEQLAGSKASSAPAAAPQPQLHLRSSGVRCSSEHWSLLPQRVGTTALKDTRPGGAFNIPGRSRLGLFRKLSEAPAAVGATPHCHLVPSARLQLPFPPADSPARRGVPKDEDRRCLAFPSAWEETQLPPSPTGLRSDVPFTPRVTLGGSVSPATTCPFDSHPLPPRPVGSEILGA